MTAFEPSARFAPPEKLQVTLVPADETTDSPRHWEGRAAELLSAMQDPSPGAWRVVGTSAAGVSSLLIDAVIARIKAGVAPERIAVIATSKESAAVLRRQFATLLPEVGYVSETPLVRSVHSLAFSLVRSARLREPEARHDAVLGRTPRLITGAQQDLIIQELLQIQAETGGSYWPENVRDSLLLVGFARQLRDFLLRAQERGLEPDVLRELGKLHDRPIWHAAGDFLAEYQEIAQLSGAQLFNASELVVTAGQLLTSDDAFLREQQEGIDSVFIDDAQNLDPKSAELLQLFTAGARCAVIAGNPEHAVFHFRGASPESLMTWEVGHEVVLDQPRFAPALSMRYAENATTELLAVADTLRRAHLMDGVPWRDMAVIVRSSSGIAAVRRALLSAGVPVTLEPTATVLAQQRLVAGLLLALKATYQALSQSELEELLIGPIGGTDAVTLRRLLRGLRQAELKQGGRRRASEVLEDLISSPEPVPDEILVLLTQRETDILQRIRKVVAAGRLATEAGASVEMILWEVWEATELSDRLMYAALRGGTIGSQADADLDAVMALFDLAGDFVERTPTAPLARFVSGIAEQELPTGTRDRRGKEPEAVALLTAHGSLGRFWSTVVVAGVQEGVWPALGETGSLFGQEELVELHDLGIDPNLPTSRTADKIAEERRLFGLACSRARKQLVVTAVLAPDNEEVEEPSRFVVDFAKQPDVQVSYDGAESSFAKVEKAGEVHTPRLLSAEHVIAELRRALEDPATDKLHKAEAARQLARLAQSGLYGAHPAHWWGLADPSESEPLGTLSHRIRLSPSKIESALTCPLRTALSAVAENDENPLHLFKGILVHAAAEAFANNVPRAEIERILDDAFLANTKFPAWQHDAELEKWRRLVGRTLDWLSNRGTDLVGTEMKVDVTVGTLDDGTEIAIYGRMDRLERNHDGKYLVVDIKTGANPLSKEKALVHPQLLAYQLAVAGGHIEGDSVRTSADPLTADALAGGVLVYPGSPRKETTVRNQDPQSEEQLQEFAAQLPEIARALRGPELVAIANDRCSTCQLAEMCPVQADGKAVTHV